MTDLPLVSTIIPVHNRPELLVEAVESVLAQTHRPIEVLVVDDGSTDHTGEVATRLAERSPDEVRVIRRATPGGPGAAREQGRQRARGAFLQYLDSDDLLLPRKFEWQVAGLLAHPECGVSYGKTRSRGVGPQTDPSATPVKRTAERIETMFPSFLAERWWDTSTPLYRREVCDRAGGWLSLWSEEDWEYDARVAALGTQLDHVPDFVSETRSSPERLSGRLDRRSLGSRAVAHVRIFAHAVAGGLGPELPEMRHFARECFLLARQAGAVGLETDARRLFYLARAAGGSEDSHAATLSAYEALAACVGWCAAGRLGAWLDVARDRVRAQARA